MLDLSSQNQTQQTVKEKKGEQFETGNIECQEDEDYQLQDLIGKQKEEDLKKDSEQLFGD